MNTVANASGQWSWWRDGQRVVVGWLRLMPFEDIPLCTVRDSRDATLLVDTLTTIEAEPK